MVESSLILTYAAFVEGLADRYYNMVYLDLYGKIGRISVASINFMIMIFFYSLCHLKAAEWRSR